MIHRRLSGPRIFAFALVAFVGLAEFKALAFEWTEGAALVERGPPGWNSGSTTTGRMVVIEGNAARELFDFLSHHHPRSQSRDGLVVSVTADTLLCTKYKDAVDAAQTRHSCFSTLFGNGQWVAPEPGYMGVGN